MQRLIKRCGLVLLAFIVAFTYTTSALASTDPIDDNGYRTRNNIIFYDPNATFACSGVTDITGGTTSDRVLATFRFLMSKQGTNGENLKDYMVAGIIGNLQQESGPTLDPSLIEGGTKGDKPIAGKGFGIAQWTGAGRQGELMKYIDKYNETNKSDLPYSNFDLQLAFLYYEMSDITAYSTYKPALKALSDSKDVIAATVAFHDEFERSADSPQKVREVRGGNAERELAKFRANPGNDTTPNSAQGTNQGSSNVKYIKLGDIPLEGKEYGVSIYGGAWKNDSWYIQNGYQATQISAAEREKLDAKVDSNTSDDPGIGNRNNPLHNTTSFAELSGGGRFTALGDLPNGAKIEVTYKGKSIIAEKGDVGGGGGDVDGKPRAVDLWWEAARLLDFKEGLAVMKVRAVDPSTPVTPVDGSATSNGGGTGDECKSEDGTESGDFGAKVDGKCTTEPVKISGEGTVSGGKVKPDARLMVQCVDGYFPDAVDPTTYGSGVNHGQGYAIDFMIPDYKSKAGNEKGWAIAKWLQAHQKELGIHYLIFDEKIWNVERDKEGWRKYNPLAAAGSVNDSSRHVNHIHAQTWGNRATGMKE